MYIYNLFKVAYGTTNRWLWQLWLFPGALTLGISGGLSATGQTRPIFYVGMGPNLLFPYLQEKPPVDQLF